MEKTLALYEAWEPVESTGNFTAFRLSVPDGSFKHTCYPVFPGIFLIYEDVHTRLHEQDYIFPEICFSISHCRHGRLEKEWENHFYHMMAGDLAIEKKLTGRIQSYFPLNHYHGISILVDVDQAPPCLSCFMEDVCVSPKGIMEKFCQDRPVYMARSLPEVEHIFSELYQVPEAIRKGYMKVKVLELMLFLSGIEKQDDELETRIFSPRQKDLAQKVSLYLSDRLSDQVTLQDLSLAFHASPSQIKDAIKSVYGTTPARMARTQKMAAAARILAQTDLSVMEIAGIHGYDNASKFAAAFKVEIGTSPTAYRKNPSPIPDRFV